MESNCSISASILLYQQDDAVLNLLVVSLASQVDTVLIYDNNEAPAPLSFSLPDNAHYFSMEGNKGICCPHNKAIALAKEKGSEYLITFDQDSEVKDDLIPKLSKVMSDLIDQGENPACVGPAFKDPRTGQDAPFIKLIGWEIQRISRSTHASNKPVSADYLITSGCLMNLSVIDEIGLLDESLFIDYVDIEWGLRARSKGFGVFGVFDPSMIHSIGDEPIRLPFVNREIPVHSPLRHYYHVRNAVILYKRSYIPFKWKCNDGIRLLAKYVVYSVFTRKPFSHFKMMSLGIFHGLAGRTGKYIP